MTNYDDRAQKSLNDLSDFLSGIGRSLEEGVRTAMQGRGNVLMVRVNDDTIRHIDTLIEAGIFKTRSEAAAYLLHEGIRSKREVFSRITSTAQEITRLREEMRSVLGTDRPDRPSPPPPIFDRAFEDPERPNDSNDRDPLA